MKKFGVVFLAAAFALPLSFHDAQARTMECKVLASKDKAVVLDCGKKTTKLKVGQTYKVRKVIEGC